MQDSVSRVIEIDINEILPNRFQPRIQFDEEEILDLSDSIKEHGVIQPLVVRSIGDKYEIIAGERRYKASVLAGKETVPVIIKNLNDKESAEVALIENIQRKNLTPIEEALSYKKILDMGYLNQVKLAERLGKSQSSIANKIRLLNLSDEVQEALLENKISERHARSLLKLSTNKLQNELLEKIITERLTVRKTDEEINKIIKNEDNDSEDATQKIIEKGEIDMNNNMNGITNIPESTSISNFDTIGVPTIAPVMPEVPPIAPVMPEAPAVAPVIPAAPTAAPVEDNQVETSVIQFDADGNVISITETSSPSSSTTQEIPQTNPIIETPENNNNLEMVQHSENLFSFGQETPESNNINQQENPAISEIKLPEPIIVTDYSKQYDPVMPQSTVEPAAKLEFKEIINIIRECSKKIEQYGYKLDVEEYDLANLYQVIFKIEK